MNPALARKLGTELVAAGVLADFDASAHGAPGLRKNHGTSAINGHWAKAPGRPSRRCSIVCEDVARALLAARAWTVDAIRGCSHTVTTAVPFWSNALPWPNHINPAFKPARVVPTWRASKESKRATESTRRKAETMTPTEKDTTTRCCSHSEGVHRPRTGRLQAYCSSCKGGKATHAFRAGTAPVKSTTPAVTSAKPKLRVVPKTAAAAKPAAKAPAKVASGSRKDPALCELKGCSEPSRRRGMCRHHYRAWLKTDRAVAAS